MTRVIIWKELREQAAVVIALVALGIGLLGASAILNPGGGDDGRLTFFRAADSGRIGLVLLAMTAGVVVGATLFAGEREQKTFAYLNLLPGSCGAVWRRKVLAGIGIVGVSTGILIGAAGLMGHLGNGPVVGMWAIVLLLLAAMAFGWGTVGSVHARTSLEGCARALGASGLVFIAALLTSLVVAYTLREILGYTLTSRIYNTTGFNPAQSNQFMPLIVLLVLFVLPLPLSAWLYSAPDRSRTEDEPDSRSTDAASGRMGAKSERLAARKARFAARPPRPPRFTVPRRLLWLVGKQFAVPAIVLAAVAILLGMTHFITGVINVVLVPVVGLVLGVLVAVTTWSDEQSSESNRFWGERRIPAGALWDYKATGGLLLSIALTVLAAIPALLVFRMQPELVGSNLSSMIMWTPGSIIALVLLGPVYGYTFGHLAALLFRKALVAGAVGLMIGGTLGAFWLPSLFGGGLQIWTVFVAPVIALVTARGLISAWAVDTLPRRRHVRRLLVGLTLSLLAVAGGLAYRAFEYDPGPLGNADVEFAESLPFRDEREVGPLLRRAAESYLSLARYTPSPAGKTMQFSDVTAQSSREVTANLLATGYRPGKHQTWLQNLHTEESWQKILASIVGKPVGVLENPAEYQPDQRYNLDLIRRGPLLVQDMLRGNLAIGLMRQHEGDPADFLMRYEQSLAAIRTTRNKTFVSVVSVAVSMESDAHKALLRWLEQLEGRPDLVLKAQELIQAHHAAPVDPDHAALAEQTLARTAVTTASRWLPRAGQTMIASQAPNPAIENIGEMIAFFWALPWEKERLRRVIGLGNISGRESDQMKALNGIPGWPYLLGMPRSHTIRNAERFHDTASAERLATLQAVAARRFYDDTQRYPKSLQELAPKYLAALPTDPHTAGRLFQYRITQTDELLVPGQYQELSQSSADNLTTPGFMTDRQSPPGVSERISTSAFTALAAVAGGGVAFPLKPEWAPNLNPKPQPDDEDSNPPHLWTGPQMAPVPADPDELDERPPLLSKFASLYRAKSAMLTPIARNRPIIWGVGPDGRDEGGLTTTWVPPNAYMTPTGDIVVPVPLPPSANRTR